MRRAPSRRPLAGAAVVVLRASWMLVAATTLARALAFVTQRSPSSPVTTTAGRFAAGARSPPFAPHRALARMSAAGTADGAAAAPAGAGAAQAVELQHYVDVHCHIVHEKFEGEEDAVAERARAKGLEFCVVNGLEPQSNRAVLELCERHPGSLLPALGIYPLDAACHAIKPETWQHPFPPPDKFDIEAEVAWIDRMCAEGKAVAVGECGLDAYYCTDPAELAEQERVLRLLIEVAKKYDLPLILHTRKAEARTFEILQEMGVTKADFHCFGGKAKLGKKIAEAGYYLSIPSVVARSESFKKLVKEVPLDRLLTETDSPYQGPEKDMRNEPATVPIGVATMAQVKGVSEADAMLAIRENFRRLFGR